MIARNPYHTTGAVLGKTLGALYAISFLSGFSLGVFNPLMSVFMESRGIGSIWIGANTTLYFLAIAAGAPLVPKSIARWGVRRVMSSGLLIAGCASAVFPLLSGLPAWSLARMLTGFGVCLYMVGGQTALNVLAGESKRASATALHAACFAIGFAVGPVLGTQLYAHYPKLAFLSGSITVLAGMLVLRILLGEVSLPVRHERARQVFRRISVPLHGVFLYGSFEGIMVSLYPLFLLKLGFSLKESGLALAFFVIGSGVGLLPVSYFADRVGRTKVLTIISALGLAAILSLSLAEHPALIFLSSGLIGACLGPIFPLTLAIVGESLGREELPAGSAWFTAAFSYGCAAGPLISAPTMAYWGDRYIFFMVGMLLALLLLHVPLRFQNAAWSANK